MDRRARLDVRRIGGRLDQRALARGEVRGGGRRAWLAKSGHGGKQGPNPKPGGSARGPPPRGRETAAFPRVLAG